MTPFWEAVPGSQWCSVLTRLQIAGSLVTGDQDAKMLARVLSSLSSLVELDMEGCQLIDVGHEGMLELGTFILGQNYRRGGWHDCKIWDNSGDVTGSTHFTSDRRVAAGLGIPFEPSEGILTDYFVNCYWIRQSQYLESRFMPFLMGSHHLVGEDSMVLMLPEGVLALIRARCMVEHVRLPALFPFPEES
jgi:hypothetical protein